MELESPALSFPTSFCCNCGNTDCVNEIQDTRVTRYFRIGGTDTSFHLAVPVCTACRKTTRRRPSGFFVKLLVLVAVVTGLFLALVALGAASPLPPWMAEHRFAICATLGVLATTLFYLLRRAKPPRTSFYQPVRIKHAAVKFTDVMSGPGQVTFLKLAFTNPDYLNVFVNANRDAIKSGLIAVVKA